MKSLIMSQIENEEEEIKMKAYRVIVTETQTYEVHIEAENKDEAEEIALEEYGCRGDISSTLSNVVLVEEEK
jgi:hypothetical protein